MPSFRGRLEVARATLAGRDHAGGGQGALPVTHVEDAAVIAPLFLSTKRRRKVLGSPSGFAQGSMTAVGGNRFMWALRAVAS
jgi:hypothetical protein